MFPSKEELFGSRVDVAVHVRCVFGISHNPPLRAYIFMPTTQNIKT